MFKWLEQLSEAEMKSLAWLTLQIPLTFSKRWIWGYWWSCPQKEIHHYHISLSLFHSHSLSAEPRKEPSPESCVLQFFFFFSRQHHIASKLYFCSKFFPGNLTQKNLIFSISLSLIQASINQFLAEIFHRNKEKQGSNQASLNWRNKPFIPPPFLVIFLSKNLYEFV